MRQGWCIGLRLPVQLRANNQSYCSRFLPSRIAPYFLIFLTMMTGLPFYLDKAESKKTKIGWFVFTIIAVIFDVFIVYVL